jgi:hypothetical protein
MDVLLQCALYLNDGASAAAPAPSLSIGIAALDLQSLLSAFTQTVASASSPVTAVSSAATQIHRLITGRSPRAAAAARQSPAAARPPLPSPRTAHATQSPSAASCSHVGVVAARQEGTSSSSSSSSNRGYARSFGGGFRGKTVLQSDSRAFGWSAVSYGSRGRTREGSGEVT